MKAQGQCRATCETLAVLKNPPVFARQANIAPDHDDLSMGAQPSVESTASAANPRGRRRRATSKRKIR
jgi:hypothetical protein